MKILVTGSAGFIGFHVVESLLKNKENFVVGIDNINDYYDINLKYARLRTSGIEKHNINEQKLIQSTKYPNYRFQKADITDLTTLEQLFEKEKFDAVINLAAQAGVRYSLENPHSYVQSNLVGFVNILECCRHNKIKHLVYASSSSVYGMNEKVPFSEEDRVDYPVSLYAATKKSNELLSHTYSHLYQIPTTGLRLFTVYGPYGRPDMAPMIFTDAIIKNKPVKVFNNGDMDRDFTYVEDVVKRISSIIDIVPSNTNPHPYYELLNLGNSKPVKLMDFISELEKKLRKKVVIEMLPMQPGDVKRTYADSSKLNDMIKNNSYISIKEGLNIFIDWYKSYYKL
jgi:UDP-glucuronate 4-epimerase